MTKVYALLCSADRVVPCPLPAGRDVVVGRGKDADARVAGKSVGARHVSLRALEDGRVRVDDLKAGETRLNDVQLSGRSFARAGDQLAIGDASVVFVVLGEKASARRIRPRSRAELEERLYDELARCERFGRAGSWFVLRSPMLRRGHRDATFRALASEAGPGAVFGELGAEGLEVLCPEVGPKEAEALAARLGAVLRGAPVGWASAPIHGRTAESLGARALGKIRPEAPAEEPVFLDPAMVRLRELSERLAGARGPVWVLGERGVGKSTLLRWMHARGGGPLLEIECAVEPPEPGRSLASQAASGAILLRHVDALSPGQLGKWKDAAAAADARLLATASRNPDEPVVEAIAEAFGGAVWIVPSLRDRKAEVLPIAESVLSRCRQAYERPRLSLVPEAKALLQQYGWPGNVRELEVAVERACLAAEVDAILPENLPWAVAHAAAPESAQGKTDLRTSLKVAEKSALLQALARTRWNVTEAARQLGLPRRTVIYRMARLGVRRPAR